MFNFNLLRKTAISAALCASCLATGIQASGQDGESGILDVVHQGIAHDALYDVCFNGQSGLAVGVAGTVLATENAGATWQKEPSGIKAALLGVSCGNSFSLAVGQGGVIMRKADGGEWSSVDSGTDQRILSVDADKSGFAMAVGGFGTVLKSTDNGLNWTPVTFDWEAIINDILEPHVYDVNISDDGVITLVAEFDLVLRSVDQGETWATVNRGDTSLFAIDFRNDATGFAVGQKGKVLKTLDGGLTWNTMSVPTRENLLDVWSSDNQVLVSGIRTLLRSRDDGLNWEVITEGDVSVQWYQAIKGTVSAGSDSVVMVGHSGRVVSIK